MKLSIVLLIVIGAVGLMTKLKNHNPYFDPDKVHHTKTGFKNPYLNSENQNKSFIDLIKMMITKRPIPKYKVIEKLSLDKLLQSINRNQNFITWVGHSTMLLHIDGKTILTDPIFSERCSPVQFAGPKRYASPSINIKSLPKIDLVIISHNHYDHLDKYKLPQYKELKSQIFVTKSCHWRTVPSTTFTFGVTIRESNNFSICLDFDLIKFCAATSKYN